ASLPAVLILTDFFIGRKLNAKTLLEKVPYFILSIVFGIIAVFAQHSYGSIQETNFFSFPQRVVFACYGFIIYLIKLFFPVSLSSYYSYPIRSDADIPPVYYLYVLLFLGLLSVIWIKRKTMDTKGRDIAFSLGFFFATILLVLQLLPVGNVIMAD